MSDISLFSILGPHLTSSKFRPKVFTKLKHYEKGPPGTTTSILTWFSIISAGKLAEKLFRLEFRSQSFNPRPGFWKVRTRLRCADGSQEIYFMKIRYSLLENWGGLACPNVFQQSRCIPGTERAYNRPSCSFTNLLFFKSDTVTLWMNYRDFEGNSKLGD